MDQWHLSTEDTPPPIFAHPSNAKSQAHFATDLKRVKDIRVLLVGGELRDSRHIGDLLPNAGPTPFDLDYRDRLPDALERLAAGGIDVILLDLSHGRAGGIDTFSRVRAQSPQVPIVVLGDLDDEALAARVAQQGAEDFLVKRYLESNLLVRSIRFAIERARRRRAEQSIARTQRETIQQERLRALGQMASGIAHDFNNSLTPILGYAEMLLLDSELPEKMRAPLELIRTAAGDAASVVRRLEEFYRPQGPSDLTDTMDLRDLVSQIPELTRHKWRDEAQRTGRSIELHLDLTDMPPVLGDARELREVMANLVINAVDAMPSGGRITLRTEAAPEFAVLEVSDTGSGMTEEVRTRCFEPFYTTKGLAGTGLGLSVCHGIIHRHRGNIEIDTAPGRGTTFRIRLPINKEVPRTGLSRAEPVLRSCRVLYIDDDPPVREVIAGMLRQLGQQVDMADSGSAGLAMFRKNQYDLVITDLGMPELDGCEVSRAVKALRPDAPVIMLTGWGQASVAEGTGRRQEADYILGKPPTLTNLREVLGMVCLRLQS